MITVDGESNTTRKYRNTLTHKVKVILGFGLRAYKRKYCKHCLAGWKVPRLAKAFQQHTRGHKLTLEVGSRNFVQESLFISSVWLIKNNKMVVVLDTSPHSLLIMIINLIYIVQFNTNGILTALYIVIKYIQTQYMHIWRYMKQLCSYTYACLHIYTHTDTRTNVCIKTY